MAQGGKRKLSENQGSIPPALRPCRTAVTLDSLTPTFTWKLEEACERQGAQEAPLTATDWGPTRRGGGEAGFPDFFLLGAKLGEEQTFHPGRLMWVEVLG